MVGIEKIKGQAEHIKGKVEQFVGKATESAETQARGKVDEAKGQVQETVADVKDTVNRQADEVQKDVAEAAGKARTALSRLDGTTLALSAAAAIILIALIGAVSRGWFARVKWSDLQRQGQATLDLVKAEATKAKATAKQIEGKLSENLEEMDGQLRRHPTAGRANGLTTAIITSVTLAGIAIYIVSVLVSGRRAA